jgi:predicted esterase
MCRQSSEYSGSGALRRSVLAVIGCVMLAATTAVPGHADDAAELQRRFDEAYRAEDWQRAITLGVELDRLVPDRPVVRYNLACVWALSGDAETAIRWLERAAASGFDRLDHLQRDPDLESLRALEGYSEVVEAVRNNAARRDQAIRRLFESAPILLAAPPNHDPTVPAPLLVFLHGYGGRAGGYSRHWQRPAAKSGVILVAAQGVRPAVEGFSWESVDEADTILRLTLDSVRQRYAVDEERIVLAGFSQGGFMAMALGTRHPELFAGVIPMAGGFVPEVDSPPPAGIQAPRYYFMVGSLDRSEASSRLAAEAFREAGYEVKLRVLPGTGHTFPRDTDRELGKALRFALGD